jgi:hypothetical protein
MPIPGTSVDCEGDIPINRTLSAAFFHLISEALTNIRRHTHGWWHGLVLLLKLDGKLPYIATPLPYDFSRSVS